MSVDTADAMKFANAEITFVGRSNAGKSSLINALCGNQSLAKIAKTPGKTRTINVYAVAEGRWMVDLPGYGFANVSKTERYSWKDMADVYFRRTSLKAIFVVIDAHVGATPLDRQMLLWLRRSGIPYRVIVNKIDRENQAKILDLQQRLPADLKVPAEHMFYLSGKKSIGIPELHECICSFLGVAV